MNKKFIPIILIIAVVAVVGGYFLLNNGDITTEHTTIVLSKSAYMEVPKYANATSKADKKGIFYYKDKNDDINITSCSNLSASSSVKEMKKLKNSIATGAKKEVQDKVVVYEKNGLYSIFVKNTQYNDTLLIQSTNKNLLMKCWQTVKYHDPTDKIKFNGTSGPGGTLVNAVEQTQSAVETTTSSAPSDSGTSTTSSEESSYSSDFGSGGYSDFGFDTGSDSGDSGGASSDGGYDAFGFR